MFDPDKTYGAVVWDMPIAVVDVEADDYVRNEDGTIKLFNMPNYDYSYICDDVDVHYLRERLENQERAVLEYEAYARGDEDA